jgi:hypothetical protein
MPPETQFVWSESLQGLRRPVIKEPAAERDGGQLDVIDVVNGRFLGVINPRAPWGFRVPLPDVSVHTDL